MSILSVMPCEWWEPADLEDEDEDPLPYLPGELLTFGPTFGWWTAEQADDDDE